MQTEAPTKQATLPAAPDFRQRVKIWFGLARMFFWGIGIASLFGLVLLVRYSPRSPLRMVCWAIIVVWIALDFGLGRTAVLRMPSRRGESDFLTIALLVLMVPLYVFRNQVWVSPAVGLVSGGFLWTLGKLRGRPVPIAVWGCLLGGAASLLAPSPNLERALLAGVSVGAAVALQAAWFIVAYASGFLSEATPISGQKSGPKGTSLYHLTFGDVSSRQIVDSDVEQQLRERNKLAIQELEGLDFRYFCCYSESFAAARLLFVYPALIMRYVLRNGDIVRLRGGRVNTYYLLLVSQDGAAFAHAFGLGVKFHTKFSDGTVLVTMNANAALPDVNRPPLVKRYRRGSLSGAWADHQRAMESLEAEGKQLVKQLSFESFVEMSHLETETQSQS